MKTACVLAKYRGLYRHRSILEDETGPRVKNPHESTRGPTNGPRIRRFCRGSAAKPGSYLPGFGAGIHLGSSSFLVYSISGVFVRIFV